MKRFAACALFAAAVIAAFLSGGAAAAQQASGSEPGYTNGQVLVPWVDDLRVRAKPDPGLPAIAHVGTGDRVVYLGEASPGVLTFELRGRRISGCFLKVRLADGTSGWVFSGGLQALREGRTVSVGGNHPDYDDIRYAVDRAMPGDTIVIAGGTYYTAGTIRIANQSGLTLKANGSVSIVCTNRDVPVISVDRCRDIRIEGLSAGHGDTNRYAEDVISVYASTNVTVRQCDLYGAGHCAIKFVSCADSGAYGNVLRCNLDVGIVVLKCRGITIKDNQGLRCGYFTFIEDFYEDSNKNYGNAVLSGNTVVRLYDDEAYYEDEDGELHMTTVHRDGILTAGHGGDYEFDNVRDAAEAMRDGETLRIEPGTYTYNYPITIGGKQNVTVEGVGEVRLLCGDPSENVVEVEGCTSVTLRNLHMRHEQGGACYAAVVYLHTVKSLTVENCELNGCGQCGIYWYSDGPDFGESVLIRNCRIHSNTLYALYLWHDYRYTEGDFASDPDRIRRLTVEDSVIENNAGGIHIYMQRVNGTFYSAAELERFRGEPLDIRIRNTVIRNNGEGR